MGLKEYWIIPHLRQICSELGDEGLVLPSQVRRERRPVQEALEAVQKFQHGGGRGAVFARLHILVGFLVWANSRLAPSHPLAEEIPCKQRSTRTAGACGAGTASRHTNYTQ